MLTRRAMVTSASGFLLTAPTGLTPRTGTAQSATATDAIVGDPAGPRSPTTWTIGVEDLEYFPYWRATNGAFEGIARKVFDTFALATGRTVDYVPLPVRRLLPSFLAGQVDFKFPDDAKWQANQRSGHQISYSTPVLAYIDGLCVPRSRVGTTDLRRVATVSGFEPFPILGDVAAGRIRLVETTGFPSMLRIVLAGRADAAYGNVEVVRYVLAESLKQPDALVFDDGLPHVRGDYRLSSITRPADIVAFDRWVTENRSEVDGIVDQFRVKA